VWAYPEEPAEAWGGANWLPPTVKVSQAPSHPGTWAALQVHRARNEPGRAPGILGSLESQTRSDDTSDHSVCLSWPNPWNASLTPQLCVFFCFSTPDPYGGHLESACFRQGHCIFVCSISLHPPIVAVNSG